MHTSEILCEIAMHGQLCRLQSTDSWTAWQIKQDLYQIKWAVEEQLRKSPTFAIEQEWLETEERKKIFEILKKDRHEI